MIKAIFLTIPSRIFLDMNEANRCARSINEKINYVSNTICNTKVHIGVSNVNPRKATYSSIAGKVGRPKRALIGNIEKCFVRPHLHILIVGSEAAKVSSMIESYMMKKYKSPKNNTYRVRLWKNYINLSDVETVLQYILVQSNHVYTFGKKISNAKSDTAIEPNRQTKNNNTNVKGNVERNITKVNTIDYDSKLENNALLCNLRFQWITAQRYKKIASSNNWRILYNYLKLIQNDIEKYAAMIKMGWDVNHIKKREITELTIKLDQIRKYTVSQIKLLKL